MNAPERVLIVDDDADIRDMARLVLAGAGFEVATATNGRAALAALRTRPFDLLLLDINMPEMDGWATLRLLRADEALADVAVAMFSVKTEVRDKVASLQDGAIDFITKPFGVDDLVARVRRILAAHRARTGSVPSTSGR